MAADEATFEHRLRMAFPPLAIDAAGAFQQRGGTYPDADEYSRRLDGKTWAQLEHRYFEQQSDALGFLGPRHLIAVLPAYLALLFALPPDSLVPEAVFYVLTKPSPTDRSSFPGLLDERTKRFDELLAALSKEQRAVVATALANFVAMHPKWATQAQIALDRFWNTFTQEG